MDKENPTFVRFDDRFESILGTEPKLELLLEHNLYPFAHEAGVYIPSTDEIFITSNQFSDHNQRRKVQISKISFTNDTDILSREEIPSDDIPMGNGGVNYKDGIMFCAQGSMSHSSGLYEMEASPPYSSKLILSSFYGRPFNSVNDVVIHSDGSIWFTDPIYGYEQGYRPKPQLPNQIYRYDPSTRNVRAMADGFGRPNGICFSPDEKIVYITDTDRVHGDGSSEGARPSTISGQPFLTNRRLFAMAAEGIPDGIKCDVYGNVYSGCGDGINVWCPGGVLLGIIKVDGGAANFCFGRDGAVFILNENRLWKAQLASSTKGALLGI